MREGREEREERQSKEQRGQEVKRGAARSQGGPVPTGLRRRRETCEGDGGWRPVRCRCMRGGER